MFSQLLFAMLALMTFFSYAPPTQDQIVTIDTDDTEKLSQMNVSALLKAIDTAESRNLSYDGTGLKPVVVYFHYYESEQSDLPPSNFTHTDSTDPRNDCFGAQCYVLRELKFFNTYVPRFLATPACSFIVQNAQPSLFLPTLIALWYENAVCDTADFSGKKPCNIVGGAIIRVRPSLPWSVLDSMLSACTYAMTMVANECDNYGGKTICASGDTTWDDSDIIHYYVSPHDINYRPLCTNTWHNNGKCYRILCSKATGICEGGSAGQVFESYVSGSDEHGK